MQLFVVPYFVYFCVFFDKQYFSKLSREKYLIELNLKSKLAIKLIIFYLSILDKVHHVSRSNNGHSPCCL